MNDAGQPDVVWTHHDEIIDGRRWVGVSAGHAPGIECVFVDRQCTCGRLDLGIIRADEPGRANDYGVTP